MFSIKMSTATVALRRTVKDCLLACDQPRSLVSTLLQQPVQGTGLHRLGNWYSNKVVKRDDDNGENKPRMGTTVANQLEQKTNPEGSRDMTRRRKKASIVELTDAALKRMRMLLEKQRGEGQGGAGEDVYVRLGVKRRGCNGLAYTLNYDTSKKKFDEEVDYSEPYGVRMLVDAGAIMHVLGTRMDYVEDDVRAEFVFVNPNASGTCGCGESFTTQSDEFKKQS